MRDYPEHEKLSKVKEKSQAVGEFLEWYSSEGGGVRAHWLVVRQCPECEGLEPEVDDCSECGGDGTVKRESPRLVPDSRSITTLLELYFKVDGEKLEEEKRAMLESIRRTA